MQMPYVSLVGAAGYTGQEALDRLLGHPELELYAVGSDSLAGRDATALDPRLNRNGGKRVPRLITNAAALACEADVTILCLPHEQAASAALPSRGVVIDLSGAHRLRDAAQYDEWYGFAHPSPGRLGEWSYGLPELSPPEGRLVANPGCYATAVLLALGPLADAIDQDSVVVDAMSGMTGAGRGLKASTHAGFVLENVSPYRVGAHQHVPEIAQALGFPVSFTPHLLRVLPEGVVPELSRVQHTDGAELGVFEDRHTDRTIVICALDNLGKGAAGQAVQNLNLLFGFAETAGLRLEGVLV
jgi:N-acetyl-gamma-glutamyl-phosphate reductase